MLTVCTLMSLGWFFATPTLQVGLTTSVAACYTEARLTGRRYIGAKSYNFEGNKIDRTILESECGRLPALEDCPRWGMK